MSKFTVSLLTGAAMFITLVGTASAQTTPEDPDHSAEGLADIVVTAQKSSENLQRTAAAVTAVTGENLISRGVADLRDAQMVIPAARFQAEANNTQVFVRGVGSNLDFPNVDPAVAFNFNGVYVPREATSSAFFDIASLEVLPGPQGTLYGRGAIGGAINVQFKRPEFNFDGSALIEGGNYDLIHGTLAQNLKVSDTVALRFAVDYRNHKGYYTSGSDAADDLAGRVSLLFKPSDRFSAYIWATGASKNGTTQNPVNHAPKGDPNDLFNGFLTKNPRDDLGSSQISVNLANFLASIGSPLPFTVGIARAEKNNYNTYSVGGEFNLELGENTTLTYIPGYTHLKAVPFNWSGALRFLNTADIDAQSHELRLAGDTGPIKWLGGLFYYHQRNSGISEISFGGPDFPNPFIQHILDVRRNVVEGEGLFGQITWSTTDRLRLVLGGRYSRDRREANGTNPEYRLPGQAPGTGPFTAPGTNPNWAFKKSYSYVDLKGAIEYDIADRVLLYATVQTAHAPGTYNPISQAGLNAGDPFHPGIPFDGTVEVQEQKLTAFSAGIKSRLADNTLQINLEAFYYNYRNLIQQQFDVTLLFNPVFNAKKEEIYGFQADILWQPSDADTLSINAGYSRARAKEFVTPSGISFAGSQPAYAPDWTVLAGYTRSFSLGGDSSLKANVAGRYESSWFSTFTHAPGTRQSAGAKVDASLTYDSGKNWQFGIWGKNLTDRTAIAAAAAAGVPGPAVAYLEAPRTFGVRFQIDY